MITILYNPYDCNSLAFIHNYPEYPTINWYDYEERNTWVLNGGTDHIANFPVVHFTHDAYRREVSSIILVDGVETPAMITDVIPAGFMLMYNPPGMGAILELISKIESMKII